MQLSTLVECYAPINRTNKAKVESIGASILESGWVGQPIVIVDGGWAITGSHRIDALSDIGSQLHHEFDVPTIELSDIFEENGLNLDEIMANEDVAEPWAPGFENVLYSLPSSVMDFYGIQCG